MVSRLIKRYKQYKKQQFFNTYARYKGKYAFVGAGNHAIHNLYPCIDFMNVPLKYIVTKDVCNAQQMALKYHATGTDSLDEMLRDDEVKGVFVSTLPELHFSICKKVLEAGKHLFVEKPPCMTSEELQELTSIAKQHQLITCTGLQKRYAEVYQKLKKPSSKASSYQYQYRTGAYPEGDPLFDLFIHPVDLSVYLFGKVEQLTLLQSTNKKTYFIQLSHASGCIGQLELSTDYSWKSPAEKLTVNTDKGIFYSEGIYDLRKTHKSGQFMGIPLEKVIKTAEHTDIIVENSGFIPLAEHNQLFVHGYFPEIAAFVGVCEGEKNKIKSDFSSIALTYHLLEKIRHARAEI